ncbi:hypothetical protein Tco_0344097 [Tanacetum coccineum]
MSRCALFEALYGRKCRSPVLWAKIRESSLIGPILVQEMIDKVKSDALEGRSIVWKEGKLRLHKELSSVHDTFHVSNLKKCLVDANLHVPINEIQFRHTLLFESNEPVEIREREIRK